MSIVDIGSGPPVDLSGAPYQLSPPASTLAVTADTIESHLGSGTDLVLSADGSTLVAAGAAGAAMLSIRDAGLIRTTVPRTADHVYCVGGRDLSWLVSGSMMPSCLRTRLRRSAVRAASGDAREGAGCTETQLTPALDATMEVGGDGAGDVLVVYTNWSMSTGAYRFYDGPTGEPISTEIQPRTASSATKVDRRRPQVDPDHRRDPRPGSARPATTATRSRRSRWRRKKTTCGRPSCLAGARSSCSALRPARRTCSTRATWTLRPAPFGKGDVTWAAFSGDGSTLATAAANGAITIRDGHTFEVRPRAGRDGRALALVADGLLR